MISANRVQHKKLQGRSKQRGNAKKLSVLAMSIDIVLATVVFAYSPTIFWESKATVKCGKQLKLLVGIIPWMSHNRRLPNKK